ncbi:hypothetical protein [Dolichospermum circinale]|nr:hypothetical protein [Dolichospermum circinale]MDB9452628.1 hypothetical protein [Dolichospermum circinale CS-547]
MSVVSGHLLMVSCELLDKNFYTNHQLPITNYQSPITHYLLPKI